MDLKIIDDKFSRLKVILKDLEALINVSMLKLEINEIEAEFSSDGFWNDHARASEYTQQLSSLKNRLSLYNDCEDLYDENEIAIELLRESHDEVMYNDTIISLDKLELKLEGLYNSLLLNGKYDKNNAIIDIHAGAGGTEAQDWVEMLYRMFTRFCNTKSYKIKVLNYHPGDPVGIKSVSFELEGIDVFGHFKSERGVHRLIRISPFDSSGKRHTSFASVDVTPVLAKTESVVIEKSDLKIDTFRASGAGGQSVNTTDSAVRITHLPSGIVVSCQNERSQIQNREYAMQLLKNKLAAHEEALRQEEINANAADKAEIGWGSQIRSYVFQPYAMVKDHRTNYESSNVKNVMDGDIEEFIIKYLEFINNQ